MLSTQDVEDVEGMQAEQNREAEDAAEFDETIPYQEDGDRVPASSDAGAFADEGCQPPSYGTTYPAAGREPLPRRTPKLKSSVGRRSNHSNF